jgi:hypothetical protein
MGLLKSVDNVPGIDFYEYRDNIYYNKYNYRARLKIPGIRYTWFSNTPQDLRDRLAGKHKAFSRIRKEDLPEIRANLEALCNFIEWRNLRKSDKKATIRVEYETAAVFCNDLTLLKEIEQFGNNLSIDYTEAQTSQYAGIKLFVNEPAHKFRIYLKSKRVKDDNFLVDLNDLLERSPSLHPSPTFNRWLKDAISDRSHQRFWRYTFTSSSHFIEYDDESTLSYLALLHGEMLGKKYKLEKRPDPI